MFHFHSYANFISFLLTVTEELVHRSRIFRTDQPWELSLCRDRSRSISAGILQKGTMQYVSQNKT